MKTRFYGLVGALVAGIALSAAFTPLNAAWVAPTTDVNGVALAGPVTYQLYVGGPGKEVAYGSPVSALSEAVLPTAAGTLCVTVTATVGGLQSDPTGEVCNVIAAPPVVVVPAKPKAPTGLTLK